MVICKLLAIDDENQNKEANFVLDTPKIRQLKLIVNTRINVFDG